jgi:hypothetical protein
VISNGAVEGGLIAPFALRPQDFIITLMTELDVLKTANGNGRFANFVNLVGASHPIPGLDGVNGMVELFSSAGTDPATPPICTFDLGMNFRMDQHTILDVGLNLASTKQRQRRRSIRAYRFAFSSGVWVLHQNQLPSFDHAEARPGCVGHLLLHFRTRDMGSVRQIQCDYGPTPARPRQQGARHPRDPGLARQSVYHQHRGLHGAGAEQVQGLLARLTRGSCRAREHVRPPEVTISVGIRACDAASSSQVARRHGHLRTGPQGRTAGPPARRDFRAAPSTLFTAFATN